MNSGASGAGVGVDVDVDVDGDGHGHGHGDGDGDGDGGIDVLAVPVELVSGGGFAGTVHGGRALGWVTGAAMSLADRVAHPHPVAVSATFAAAPQPGPGTVVVRRLKAGRTYAGFHASLVQDDVVRVEALITAGRLPELSEPDRWAAAEIAAPDLPDREECVGGARHEPSRGRRGGSPDDGSITLRMDPGFAPPPYGPEGNGDIRAWVTGTEPDPSLRAIVLCDALPPITLGVGVRAGWVPTLQYQVVLRRLPPAGWLKARQWGTLVAGGLVDESCTLWSPAGTVVAQARQLAAYRES